MLENWANDQQAGVSPTNCAADSALIRFILIVPSKYSGSSCALLACNKHGKKIEISTKQDVGQVLHTRKNR